MSSSFPPSPTSDNLATPLSNVLDELARMRTRVASEDRTELLDSIRRMDHDLRSIDRRARAVAQLAQSALETNDEQMAEAALRDASQLFAARRRTSLVPPPPR